VTLKEKIALWDAVNRYVQACGGNTCAPNSEREKAVVAVERIVEKITALPDSIQEALNSGDGTYRP
jgi:hypothetical protein